MKREILFIGIALAVLYLIIAIYYLPATGITWDETRHASGAKARTYSIYSWATGSLGLEMCSLDAEPVGDDIGRCWDGRPRLSQTLSGITYLSCSFSHMSFSA